MLCIFFRGKLCTSRASTVNRVYAVPARGGCGRNQRKVQREAESCRRQHLLAVALAEGRVTQCSCACMRHASVKLHPVRFKYHSQVLMPLLPLGYKDPWIYVPKTDYSIASGNGGWQSNGEYLKCPVYDNNVMIHMIYGTIVTLLMAYTSYHNMILYLPSRDRDVARELREELETRLTSSESRDARRKPCNSMLLRLPIISTSQNMICQAAKPLQHRARSFSLLHDECSGNNGLEHKLRSAFTPSHALQTVRLCSVSVIYRATSHEFACKRSGKLEWQVSLRR